MCWTFEPPRPYGRFGMIVRCGGIPSTTSAARRSLWSWGWLPLLAGALLALVAGCGEDHQAAPPPGFVPVELARATLRPVAEAGSADLVNQHLSAGRSFSVVQYEAQQFPCVRTD